MENDDRGLFERLKQMHGRLSKGQKRIANYIEEHYEVVAYETATRVGQACQVSESTVVRFALQLGYEGYPEFQTALQEDLRRQLTLPERMTVLNQLNAAQKADFWGYALDRDMQLLKRSKKLHDKEAFEACVNLLLNSRRVFIAGVRSSAPMVQYLSYYLSLFLPDVRAIQPGASSEMVERLLPIGPEDLLIGLSFPRYSLRTVRAMAFARSRGATTVGITDRATSPLANFSDRLLLVPCDMLALADSLTAVLNLLTALIAAAADRSGDRVELSLDLMETARESYDHNRLLRKDSEWEAEYEP